jgi:hypothetical protein
VVDPANQVAFIACIEIGVLERQALLLFESIRRYTDRFSASPIYALSPRAGHGISNQARSELDRLNVTYIDKVLNTECTEYGSANRVAAAAHVERTTSHEILVVLDSDTLFLRAPEHFLLPDNVDAAIRPVDVKGMCTGGSTDPSDLYWRDLCRCCDVNYEDIPWTESFVDRQQIKASYNGGLVVVRSNSGILQKWSRFFFASVRQKLTPYKEPWLLRSGVSWVEANASKFWGSNQAALALAIWSTTRKVEELPPTYNYPLHQHEHLAPAIRDTVFPHLVHVHYHWLFEENIDTNPLFSSNGPLTGEQHEWLLSSICAG